MILLKSLRYRDAVTFREKTLVPLMKQGRVFLAGRNQDTGGSNGAGKSTIFEVLQHILFSTTSKGFSRGKFAKSGYMAELLMEVDDHEYKILQFRGAKNQERKDGYKIYKDKVDITPKGTRHMADCIAKIKEIIGITEEEFRGYIYLAQEGTGHVLITGKGAAKRDYLSDLFTLDRYDSVREGVDEELETINNKVDALSKQVSVRAEILSQLEEISLSPEDFVGLAQSVAETEKFVQTKDETWSEKLKEVDEARARAEERSSVRKKLDTVFPNWDELDVEEASDSRQKKLRKLTSRVSKLEELQDLLTEKEDLEADYIDDVALTEEQAVAALSSARSALATLTTELTGIRRRLALENKLPDISAIGADVPTRLSDAEGNLSVTEHRLREAEGTLKKLSKLTDAECPTCGQPLDVKAIAEQRTKTEGVVTAMAGAIKTAKTELRALRDLASKMEEYGKIEAQIGELPAADLAAHKESITSYEQQVDEMENVLDNAKENARIARRLGEISDAVSEFSDSLDVSTLEDCKAKVRKLEKSLDKLDTIRKLKERFAGMEEIELLPEAEYKYIARLANFYREAQKELAAQKQDVEIQKKRAETLQNRLSELETQLEEWEPVQQRKTLFEAMKAAYGPKGLKVHQLKKICTAICKTLPKYTTIMFQEARVEFFVDNDPDSTEIEFYVRRFTPEGTEEYPVGGLSGGEKKRLAVAMIFSLAELVAPRKRCNLVILDEVGDGLDPIGEEAFASQLLPQLHQDTVICTSHRPGIEAARFDEQWAVTKKNNKSTLALQ